MDPFTFDMVSASFSSLAVAWGVDEFQDVYGDIIELMVVRFGEVSANGVI